MNKDQTFGELLKSARTSFDYKVQQVILDLTEQIVERMSSENVSKSELAKKMRASAPYISKLLRGETNFTAESMVKVADALECDVEVKLITRKDPNAWFVLFDKTVGTKREFQVWSQSKDDTRVQRQNMRNFQAPPAPQLFFHESH